MTRHSQFKVLEIGNAQTVEEARGILLRHHVNVLMRVFGNDLDIISKDSFGFFFRAAAELLTEKKVAGVRRQIFERLIRVYSRRKMSGMITVHPDDSYKPKKKKKRGKKNVTGSGVNGNGNGKRGSKPRVKSSCGKAKIQADGTE